MCVLLAPADIFRFHCFKQRRCPRSRLCQRRIYANCTFPCPDSSNSRTDYTSTSPSALHVSSLPGSGLDAVICRYVGCIPLGQHNYYFRTHTSTHLPFVVPEFGPDIPGSVAVLALEARTSAGCKIACLGSSCFRIHNTMHRHTVLTQGEP